MDAFKQVAKGEKPNGTNGVTAAQKNPEGPEGMQLYRAPSLLQPHRARDAFADAHAGVIQPLFGFFCGVSSPPMMKAVAQLGYDIIGIDWEHAATNVETMTQMVHDIQFFSEGRSHALVRLPNHEHSSIGYALDAGASIMVPQVDTVEQARHIVSSAKFGANINGTRSAPPMRWLMGISDTSIDPSISFHQNLNRQAAIVIQIECVKAVHNLDEILTAVGEHIDSVWLGSLDLRISMGLLGIHGEEPEWLEVLRIFESTLAKHNKPASGMAFGPPDFKATLARGRSMVIITADIIAVQGTIADLTYMKENYPAKSYEGVFKK